MGPVIIITASLVLFRFGTFLCNCDKERHDLSLYARSPSLWAHLMADSEALTNPDYSPNKQVSGREGDDISTIGQN